MIFGRKDVRKFGTGNSGASNVTSLIGWKAGISTAIIDMLKGVIPILLIKALYPEWNFYMLFTSGAFVVLGHIFPILLKLRGGKGTAPMAGVLIGLDYRVALICMTVLTVLLLITDYVTPGVIAVCVAAPLLMVSFGYSWDLALILSPICALMIFKHIPNIKRINNHNEIGLREFIKRRRQEKRKN